MFLMRSECKMDCQESEYVIDGVELLWPDGRSLGRLRTLGLLLL